YISHMIWEDAAPSLIGGGKDLIQYFVGATPSQDVLQLLRMPQYVDTNGNLVNDSNLQLSVENTNRLQGASPGEVLYSKYSHDEGASVVWRPDSSTEN